MIKWGHLTDSVIKLLESALDIRAQRQELIAANVANLDTPNYTRKDLDFEATLADYLDGFQGVSLSRTNPRHLTAGDPNPRARVQDSQEGVDIDQEMIRLTQNNLLYQANVQMLIKKLESLRVAIEGGK